jgi:putative ABC transport system permease protein
MDTAMKLGMSWIDWKLGARMLVRFPGLTVIGGVTLAVAIAIGAAWFEVTHQIVSPRLPLDDGDRIVRLELIDVAAAQPESRALYDLQIWREQLTSLAELGAYRAYERNLIMPDGVAHPARVAHITPSAFPLTRAQPLLGRTLVEADAEPGAADVLVIGYDIWRNRFNGDRGVIGRTVRLGRTPATIVGVMPEGFGFPVHHEVWTPLRLTSAEPRTGMSISVFARLADGATLESAQAELDAIGQRLAVAHPATHAQLRPQVEKYAGLDARESALIRLSNIVALLILVAACANVATLLFARTATREAEIVVRNALGASRGRVMSQLFVETLVLCLVAAVVGLTMARFGLEYGARLVITSEQDGLPFWFQFRISAMTIIYALILAVAGAAMASLLPAIKATGSHVQSVLKLTSGGSASMRFGGVWSVMIVLQVATAALCLPLGAFAVVWTLHDRVSQSSFPTHQYLTFRPQLDRDAMLGATDDMADTEFRAHLLNTLDALQRRLETESSVVSVTFASGLPGLYNPLQQLEAQRGDETPVLVDADIESDRVKTAAVDIGYFDTFRFPLIAGRAFNAGDVTAGNVAIINETLARNIGGNALGVRVRYRQRGAVPAGPWYEVVGVVRDAAVKTSAPDFIFLPASAADVSPLNIAVLVRGNAAAFAPRLNAIAAEVEPGLRLYALMSLDEVMRRNERPEFYGMLGMVALTLLLMALSAAGLYSLMSVAVTRRTREIGIRLAIGASPRAVLRALFGRAAAQVSAGIVVALVLLPPFMTQIGISELPLAFVVQTMSIAAAGMLLTGFVACSVPARRAMRIEPTEAVKYGG